MASDRSFVRWLRVLAILMAVAVPVIAVSTVEATAHESASAAAHARTLDSTTKIVSRDAMPKARPKATPKPRPTRRPVRAAARPTAADRARASRSLVRFALTRPTYVRPVPGPITQWYGYHPGIDIAPPFGTPIGAAHSGVVTFVGWQDGYGMHVEVRQLDGFMTTYSHMSAFTVKVGQIVTAGQQLGNVGSTGYSTGPHLHFEVHLPDGSRTDPAAWLRSHGVTV
jgi:murein DD-endopeptidase MepM/ murein hydrolase activator NlpD